MGKEVADELAGGGGIPALGTHPRWGQQIPAPIVPPQEKPATFPHRAAPPGPPPPP